jgi:hypothetical protein
MHETGNLQTGRAGCGLFTPITEKMYYMQALKTAFLANE